MTTQAELQAQLDEIAERRAGIISLPIGGDKDTLRRAVCRQVRDLPPEVLAAMDCAVDAAGVLAAILKMDVRIEWI